MDWFTHDVFGLDFSMWSSVHCYIKEMRVIIIFLYHKRMCIWYLVRCSSREHYCYNVVCWMSAKGLQETFARASDESVLRL